MRAEIIDYYRNTQIVVLDNPNQVNHRSAVIVAVCELESLVTELLVRFCLSQKSQANEAQLENMFKDSLGSLKKNAEFAFCLGLTSLDQRNGLRALGKLRDEYAHNALGQLQDEPELFKLLTDTELYKRSREQLRGLDEQGVFRCFRDQLKQDLNELLDRFPALPAH